jgi:hypothetical protein
MATGTIIPSPIFTGIDTNGDPVSGGKLYTYAAGTTTAQTTYSNVTLTSANANPVVLDSAGRATLFVSAGSSFKYVLKTSADVTIWTADNIGAVPKSTATLDVTVTAGEDLTALDCVYISQGDGSKTAGRAYKTDADQTYSSSLAINLGLTPAAISSGETGSIRVGGSLGGYTGLTSGGIQYVSATAGALTESAPTNVQIVGQATSTTEVMMAATISQLDASKITSGRLDNARLPTNIDVAGTLDVTGVTTLDSSLTVGSGSVALVGTDGKINGPLSTTIIDDLSGANLTSLNAGNISSGTLVVARGGTGAATHTSGNILLGNGTSAITSTAVPLVVGKGGTGATSLTSARLLIGNGTGAVAVTGDATLNGDLTVVGTGPHVIGGSVDAKYRLWLAGNWTSGGATRTTGTYVDGVITAGGGETFIEGINCANEFVTAAGETVTRLCNLAVGVASISVGAGGTVTKAASFYVGGASTGASTNLAVWIDDGTVQIDENLVVTGSVSKGSGSFRIRHPLPSKNATHELVHSFIEGPQCDLIYRGSATLVAGSATVNLDTNSGMSEGTWVLLCRDEQCFTSNETGWSSVRGSVSGNILTIECEDATSTDTISWMVVAERHDDHIKATDWTDDDGRPIVEPEQAEEESA